MARKNNGDDNKRKNPGVILLMLLIIASLIANQAPDYKQYVPYLVFAALLVAFATAILGIRDAITSARARKRARKAMETLEKLEAQQPQPAAAPTASTVIETPAPSQVSAHVPKPTQTTIPLASSLDKTTMKVERIHVRGTSHYKSEITSVGTENPDYSLTKRELAEDHEDERVYQYDFYVKPELVPEPDNEYDPNAIMVMADGVKIGYVPKGSTSHIRKLMDSGRIKSMDIEIKGGKYKEVYENDDGGYDLDRGDHEYSATVELYLIDE